MSIPAIPQRSAAPRSNAASSFWSFVRQGRFDEHRYFDFKRVLLPLIEVDEIEFDFDVFFVHEGMNAVRFLGTGRSNTRPNSHG